MTVGWMSCGSAAESGTPTPAGNRPARAERGTQQYDNTFRYGVAKDGVPYFSRGGKPRRTDEGTATLTPQEASRYFTLLKTDNDAWIAFKRELYGKYAAA